MSDFQFVNNDEYHIGVFLGDDAPTFNELLKATPLGKTIVEIKLDDTPFIWELVLEDKECVTDRKHNRERMEREYDVALRAFLYESDKEDTGFNLWVTLEELFKGIRNWVRGFYG